MAVPVYFIPQENISSLSDSASELLDKLVNVNKFQLNNNLPIKIHPGAVGNTAYIKSENYNGIISYLKSKAVSPYFVETCMSNSGSSGKLKEFETHGFNQIPIVMADGKNGDEHQEVPIQNSKNLKYSLIAQKLYEVDQVLVVNHFKGHCMAGFGGAIKMLGIGFASSKGKTLVHGKKDHFDTGDSTDWKNSHLPGLSPKWVQNWNPKVVSSGEIFNQRVAESAWAASHGKQFLYLTFVTDIVSNCDCDGEALEPVYKNVGLLASVDPVAIDKASFDLIEKQIGEVPFAGSEIFEYAESLGVGITDYKLVNSHETAG